MTLGQKLKQLRIESEKTAEEVAKTLNIGRSTLSNYENDIRKPDYDTLIKFSNLYQVSLDYLLGRTDERNPEKRKIYTGDELAELLPEPYKTLFKKQNLGYVKFANELAKYEIDLDKLIKLIEITENIRLEVENENNEDNS